MHDFDLILTLTGGFVSAVIFGYITQRLRLSPIVGYLLAGPALQILARTTSLRELRTLRAAALTSSRRERVKSR